MGVPGESPWRYKRIAQTPHRKVPDCNQTCQVARQERHSCSIREFPAKVDLWLNLQYSPSPSFACKECAQVLKGRFWSTRLKIKLIDSALLPVRCNAAFAEYCQIVWKIPPDGHAPVKATSPSAVFQISYVYQCRGSETVD